MRAGLHTSHCGSIPSNRLQVCLQSLEPGSKSQSQELMDRADAAGLLGGTS